MKWHPPLHPGVVAFEKGAFGSPSTMVTKFTYYIMIIACLANFIDYFSDVTSQSSKPYFFFFFCSLSTVHLSQVSCCWVSPGHYKVSYCNKKSRNHQSQFGWELPSCFFYCPDLVSSDFYLFDAFK